MISITIKTNYKNSNVKQKAKEWINILKKAAPLTNEIQDSYIKNQVVGKILELAKWVEVHHEILERVEKEKVEGQE